MNIRGYAPKDQENVSRLIRSILQEEYPFEKSAYSETDLKDIGKTYGGDRDSFYVAENDSAEIIGTIAIKEDSEDVALMRRLFLNQNYRGKGYGINLIDTAISFCKSKGYRRIAFRATDKMVNAMTLLKKKSFQEDECLDLGGFKIFKLILDIE